MPARAATRFKRRVVCHWFSDNERMQKPSWHVLIYLPDRDSVPETVASGKLETAHSKVDSARAGLRRKRERVNADPADQAA